MDGNSIGSLVFDAAAPTTAVMISWGASDTIRFVCRWVKARKERQKRERQRRVILAMTTPAGIDPSTFAVIRRVMLAIVDSGGESALLTELRNLEDALDRLSAAREALAATEALLVSLALQSLPRHIYCAPEAQAAPDGQQSPASMWTWLPQGATAGGGDGSGDDSIVHSRRPPQTSPAGPASSASEAPTCAICLDDFQDGCQVVSLQCRHQFHVDCVEPWLRQKGLDACCPLCKHTIYAR